MKRPQTTITRTCIEVFDFVLNYHQHYCRQNLRLAAAVLTSDDGAQRLFAPILTRKVYFFEHRLNYREVSDSDQAQTTYQIAGSYRAAQSVR